MTTSPKLRLAKPEDSSAMTQAYFDSLNKTRCPVPETIIQLQWDGVEKDIQRDFEEMKNNLCTLVVATDPSCEDKIVGFTKYSITPQKGYVDKLYNASTTIPAGSYMLNHVILVAQHNKQDIVTLDAVPQAVAHYSKLGFVPAREKAPEDQSLVSMKRSTNYLIQI